MTTGHSISGIPVLNNISIYFITSYTNQYPFFSHYNLNKIPKMISDEKPPSFVSVEAPTEKPA